jgi:DNA-binding GntR family transcriptional regulator
MLPTSMLAASSRRRSASESLNAVAYRRIKEQIVELELPPASLLDEVQLAAGLELGLTPVRQALHRLALENLVVILPRRGTMVADLNRSDLRKIFEIRVELEALAAQLAAQRATPEQVATLVELVDTTRHHLHSGDKRALLRLDRELHATLAECAQNEFLAETLDGLYSHVLRLWNLALQQVTGLPQAMDEHRQIVEAVAAGDAGGAARQMRAHVQHFQQHIGKVLELTP